MVSAADRRRLETNVTDRNTPQINRFVAEHNWSPKPFVWRAEPDAIIAPRGRGFQALEPNR